MEGSGDRYLHKKFKKQLNIEPNPQTDQERAIALSTKINESMKNYHSLVDSTEISSLSSENIESIPVINSNNDVPKVSTNSENTFNATVSDSSNVAKSSISQLNLTNVKEKGKSSKEETVDILESHSSNGCISFVISKSSRIENLNQPESHVRAANFDMRFNVSEPITIPTASTSSILNNVYPNHYVTSKLVNVDKIEDISSNSSLSNNDHLPRQELETKIDHYTQDLGISEKNSGGKYICSYCNLACSKPSVLQKHIRAHTNERPYPCVSCGFSFKTRSNLYKHCRSRTHANRVMGNKTQEINSDFELDSRTKLEYLDQNHSMEFGGEDFVSVQSNDALIDERSRNVDIKTKPYKPRFHTAKIFFDSVRDNEDQKISETVQNRPSNSDLLSLHINDVISKNNAIVNSNESFLLRKRTLEHNQIENSNNEFDYRHNELVYRQYLDEKCINEEPLNLTNKTRKRCLSEVAEPTMHTSLIKELLLKNLYADSMQCQHCKMIFQTVTELELHKMRSCKGFTKIGARYSRSSSVNVASILTKNKNAFDTIPHLQNTTFSLKSPGPFLGKTQLVESDKNKSFSFDDGLPNFQNNLQNPSDILKTSLRYSISPLTIKNDKAKKPPIKLFGGEVKITHTSGTTKNLKFDNREEDYTNYCGRLSENRVVKSGLQSGGTVLQNKQYYNNNKQDSHRSSPEVIRVYENASVSPSIDLIGIEKPKFEFDRQNHDYQNQKLLPSSETTENSPYICTNIMDFSQKAVKMLAPNLKQLNLTIPGILVPSMSTKIVSPCSPSLPSKIKPDLPKVFEVNDSSVLSVSKTQEPEIRHIENIEFAQKQILLHQKASSEHIQSPSNYNPVNLLVNGKVVRYVPGMPGPVAADVPPYNSSICSTKLTYSETTKSYTPSETEVSSVHYSTNKTPEPKIPSRSTQLQIEKKHEHDSISKSPKFSELEIKISDSSVKMTEIKPISVKSISTSGSEVSRKFVRPNTLALKPSIAFSKQHHGLTPTMFNQILISPDTPRVAKKYMQHFLHGNYFSYLGLKSSTKSVYCTLNKTQPFYVPHFKKLSMYSEWRQQDKKGEKLYVSAYDSRQKQQKYVTAGKATVDFVVHSSYKFLTEVSCKEEHRKSNSIIGGYESNEDYTYIRGRGRGRYVCDQCGIRCKKPSMLKKHIRTHTNDRPFTCNHCNFSFKTKGNLTKHMKSKVHSKNHAASSSSNSSAQQSGTQSSESDTDDSGMDSSDESTRQQEHEAAYGLLSLSQKTTQNTSSSFHIESYQSSPNIVCSLGIHQMESQGGFMNTEQVTQVNNSNFAKNKILDHGITLNFNTTKIIDDLTSNTDLPSKQMQNVVQFLGKTNTGRPLTYPYMSDVTETEEKSVTEAETQIDQRNVSTFNIVQKHNVHYSPPGNFSNKTTIPITISYDSSYLEVTKNVENITPSSRQVASPERSPIQFTKLNSISYDVRKRKADELTENNCKLLRINSEIEAMDLTMPSLVEKSVNSEVNILRFNGAVSNKEKNLRNNSLHEIEPTNNSSTNKSFSRNLECRNAVEESTFSDSSNSLGSNSLKLSYKLGNVDSNHKYNGTSIEINETRENKNAINLKLPLPHNGVDINYLVEDNQSSNITTLTEAQNTFSSMDYDNSAMETLADVATKQVKLEKNILAKTVASEYLKIATKYEFQNSDGIREISNFSSSTKEVNELIVKPEENKNCTICAKNFSKPSQLRLHMNIHYLERPFRCDPCSISFRTKGHLQKHERSASHHKLSSSPLLSSSEPRPFKCSDCNIAFRIHGHLAKHLRSKMHIMKLECLAKIPFGLYAELERANSLLTEINTTDGDQCLESLKALARKVFINDPSKLNQLQASLNNTDTSDS